MITVAPQGLHRLGEVERPTCTVTGAIKDLVERGGVRLPHQQFEQVLLKGLVSPRRALPKHRVGLLRYPGDLDADHAATVAPPEPNDKRFGQR